jgi:glycosyltransferase involved in cell wall biosynthesis
MKKESKAVARPKLLFVVTEDWYFVSHRLPLALGAIDAGMDVALATNIGKHGDLIRRAGIELHEWDLDRGSTGIWSEIKALFSLFRIFLRVRPTLVHQVAIKPVLYGTLIARLTGMRKVVNALGGLGFLFSDDGGRKSMLRSLVLASFRWLLSGKDSVLILQNPDDCDLLTKGASIDRSSIRLIRGAGVDLQMFNVTPQPDGTPMVILPARMLLDKGVGEFVEAARILKAKGAQVRFALVGGTDECNPACVSTEQLQRWVEEGHVEWLGRCDDMPAMYAAATLVCLPSYREGLPKALLEAAACGRAIVATDVPGCREIVVDGENGLLVPARDPVRLADAIESLLKDPARREQMGRRGRIMAAEEFSEGAVIKSTMEIYRALVPVPAA